jgi:hypothetical protein
LLLSQVSYELRDGSGGLVGAHEALELQLGCHEGVAFVETCAKLLCVGQTATCRTTLEDLRGARSPKGVISG